MTGTIVVAVVLAVIAIAILINVFVRDNAKMRELEIQAEDRLASRLAAKSTKETAKKA